MIQSEEQIRANAPIELFKVNGKPVKVGALSADAGDTWLREHHMPIADIEARLNAQRQRPALADGEEAPVGDATSAEFIAAMKAAIIQYVNAASPKDADAVRDNVCSLSFGQLLAVISTLAGMNDPLSVSICLNVDAGRQFRAATGKA